MTRAEPRKLPVAIFLMNAGTSMCVGQAMVQGASWQNRHLLASSSAASLVSGGAMSAKFAASCSSLRGLGPCTDCSPLPASGSHAHPDHIHEGREEKAHEPRPIVDRAEHAGLGDAAQRGDEARQTGQYADHERADRHPVEAAGVLVRAVTLVEVVHDQLTAADDEVVGDHDS